MLQIIGGQLRGARLNTPKGKDFRPTLGKTREALFSVITSRYNIRHYDCFDLFAGSGALGLEAVSRGAKSAFFVENNRSNYQLLKKNIHQLSLDEHCQAYFGDSIKWLDGTRWGDGLNLFFVDPPYKSTLAQAVLSHLAKEADSLQNSLVVVEAHKDQQFTIPQSIVSFQQKTYGSTRLEFYEITNRSDS